MRKIVDYKTLRKRPNEIQTYNANDYIPMMKSVAFKNMKYLCKYNWEVDEVVNELWLATNYALKRINHSENIDGYVMITLHNKIRHLLNKETYLLKRNVQLEDITEIPSTFELTTTKYAYEQAKKVLPEVEQDVLEVLVNSPATLQQKLLRLSDDKNKSYSRFKEIAKYLGFEFNYFKEIVKNIQEAIVVNLTDDSVEITEVGG